jgi:hypothetical protein
MDNFLNHFIFFIANAYISSDKLLLMIEEGPETEHFDIIIDFTGVFYFILHGLRTGLCLSLQRKITRFLDDKSINVTILFVAKKKLAVLNSTNKRQSDYWKAIA